MARNKKRRSSGHRNGSRLRKSSNKYLPLINFGVAGLAASFVIIVIVYVKPPTIGDDLCRTDADLQAHTIFLIDASDKISKNDQEYLSDAILGEATELNRFDKLSVMFLGEQNEESVEEIFSLCNPGDASQINQMVEPTRVADIKWKDEFEGPLKDALVRLSKMQEASFTPLLEGFNNASRRRDFDGNIATRKLILVSDMLHHNDDFSIYRMDYKNNNKSEYLESQLPNFRNVDFSILLIDRTSHRALQKASLKEFWTPYLKESGVSNCMFYRYSNLGRSSDAFCKNIN